MSDVSTVLQVIADTKTRQALWDVVLDYYHAHGVTMVSYHSVHANGASDTINTDGFPPDWVCAYIEQDLVKIDPIPEVAARLTKPFFWHDIRNLTPMTDATKKYLAAFETAGVGDGLAFYVHGPGLRNAYVGLGFGAQRVDLPMDRVYRFQCVAQVAHLRVCSLIDAIEAPAPLTAREREVLGWIARGKSNSVIADILGLSRHTVDTHLRSIYRKLGVTDRTSAALRGVGSGLLQYT